MRSIAAKHADSRSNLSLPALCAVPHLTGCSHNSNTPTPWQDQQAHSLLLLTVTNDGALHVLQQAIMLAWHAGLITPQGEVLLFAATSH